MPPWRSQSVFLVVFCGLAFANVPETLADNSIAGVEFFEAKIRPVLIKHCYGCHSNEAKKAEGGLKLDSKSGMTKGGDSGAMLVPAKPGESLLLSALKHSELKMPPDKKLPDGVIQDFEHWIKLGAPVPQKSLTQKPKPKDWQQRLNHWAFQPINKKTSPPKANTDWALTNIDQFVSARWKDHGLSPVQDASRETLLRRLTFDLIGLPPTIAEQNAFLGDQSPKAVAKLVDRLLESPHFGERWGRHWLDVMRYGDCNGGDESRPFPNAYHFRNYVINNFNRDVPYDRMVTEHLAGDLVDFKADAEYEPVVGTGFLAVGTKILTQLDAKKRIADLVDEQIDAFGRAMLGMTIACARCHDHKFDPLRQQDYYQFFAYFNQTPVTGAGGDPQTAPTLAVTTQADQEQLAAIESQIRDATDDEQRKKLTEQQDKINKRVPKVMIMEDQPTRRDTFILSRGLYNVPTQHKVDAATPASLPAVESERPQNRLHLAQWLMSADNPLPARVTVNRLWQQIMGQGLVKTTEDFGVQGEYPVQKDLLDWLAADFRDNGWDIKRLIRMIVTSHTYCQSSNIRTVRNAQGEDVSEFEIDPENRLLARSPRFRLPSFVLRDQALAACGLLNPKVGGPPIHTYQPGGVWAEPTFGKKKHLPSVGDNLYRRSLYIFWRRIVAPTVFFDNASRQTCMVKMLRTNTPMHSLLTLNETTYVESARTLAQQLLLDESLDDSAKLRLAFRRIICREITPEESVVLLQGLARSRSEFSADNNSASALLSVGDSERDASLDAVRHAAWTSLCLAILNLDETLTRE